ncbi:MAG TPA: anthranilate phosphoribosyltransferase [Planctomycetes bacterium]|nr:anthranilate phosphoribosyltransferase [Planctomycetota bacterium]HIL37382.1 anthranilate phosphoribosyltransferase [Planctomycetota bacterium]
MNTREALAAVQGGAKLSSAECEEIFGEVLGGKADALVLAALLSSLAQRRETRDELLGAVRALRGSMLPFEHSYPDAIDTCGTGGDGLGTFNLSTAAALVAAAAGAQVVKHGNRAASSKSGSADLLEALGVCIELTPEQAREVLEQVGITYLHAPLYHPAMRHAGPVRRALGIRTIFNSLGPLANPGGVRRQLVGVSDGSRVEEVASILESLGHERALVVHGGGGADELTLDGPNMVRCVGSLKSFEAQGVKLGLDAAPVSALAGGDAQHNAGILQRLLVGDGGPLRDALLYNVSAALVLAEKAASAEEGLQLAAEALDSGAAKDRLEQWVQLSQAVSA